MAFACHARVTTGALKKTKRRSLSKRGRLRRARYRRRRLVAVAILACLFFSIGTQAAAFVKAETGNPADETPAPAHKTTEDLAASRNHKPPTETKDHSSRKEALKARKEAAKRARKEAAREARKEAAKEARQEQARRAAAKEAEEASGDPLDVLVLGVDRRPDAAKGSSARSDTIMLVRVVPATGAVKLLSVPRDLYVEVEPGKEDRINSAYAYGGVDQTRAVMEDLTGVDIDNYVVVDFKGFEKVIDAIGGVRVDVGSGVFPEQWNMGEGMEHLNGYKALKYARYRGTPRADLDRIDHQQKLLAALRRQALRWNIITKLPGIIKVTNENVNTDLGVLQVIPLARALVLNGKDNKMTTAELKGSPTSLPGGEQVLMPDKEANEKILQDFRQ
jgi:polyisoprenyl-teichoic acid--peptidoglycan teichoic acid transferase